MLRLNVGYSRARICTKRIIQGSALPSFILCLSIGLSGCNSATTESHPAAAASPHESASATASVTVSPQIGSTVGLKTGVAETRNLALNKTLTGRIQADVGKEIDVSSRVNARVDSIAVPPGSFLAKGALIATLTSKDVSDIQAQLIEASARLMTAKSHEERERQIYKEQVQLPPALLEARTAAKNAKVQRELAANSLRRQQTLLHEKIGAMKDLVAAKAQFEAANLECEQAEANLKREEALFAGKGVLRRTLQAAQAEALSAEKQVQALKSRLKFLGVDEDAIARTVKDGTAMGTIHLRAPGAGVVTFFDVGPGELVEAEKPLFRLTDLSTALVEADLPEIDVHKVQLGDAISVKVPGLANPLPAKISFIANHVNTSTRTVPIRARISDQTHTLKVGMFADVILAVEETRALSVPKAAIQEIEGRKCVFVKTAQGFVQRPIQIGAETDHFVQVLSGLAEGEEVATDGSLMLKTEITYRH